MAVIKGRSRGNGKQLANYLLKNKENDRVQVLDIRGTAQVESLEKSLLEMSLSSELTKGKNGLYHLQFNPAIGEDQQMTAEDWLKAAEILDKHLGLEDHKRAIVLHEKNGRTHAHIAWERYDHETGKLWDDGLNYRKHDKAREEIELLLGHERTRQQEREIEHEETQKIDHKKELSSIWEKTKGGQEFVIEAEKAGYQIAVADDRRPWRVITPEGESLDLVRQLETAKTKDVRERLQPIRDELLTEAEALKESRERQEQLDQEQVLEEQRLEEARDLSDSQDLFLAMLDKVKNEKEIEPEIEKPLKLSITFSQPLFATPQKEQRGDELSDSQEKADALLNAYRQKQAERERQQKEQLEKVRQMQEAAKELIEKQEQDDRAAELLRQYREKQAERERNRDKGLGLDI